MSTFGNYIFTRQSIYVVFSAHHIMFMEHNVFSMLLFFVGLKIQKHVSSIYIKICADTYHGRRKHDQYQWNSCKH